MKFFQRKLRTGLVLSGGAIRGIAHLGVLQALIDRNIRIDIISGASAGALAGAFFSEGFSPAEILEIFSKKKLFDLVRISIPRSGLFKVEGLKKILRNYLKTPNLEDLPIPLIVSATNFSEGNAEYFESGSLIDILIASSSIPILFELTKINGVSYTDGGVTDNLPIEPIRDRCRNIIACHVNPLGEFEAHKNPIQVIERTFHLAIASEINRKKELVDLFIEPAELSSFGLLEFRKSKKIFEIGYKTAQKALDDSIFNK